MSSTTQRPLIDPLGGTTSTEAIARQSATKIDTVPEGVADFNTREPVAYRAALMLGEGLGVGDIAIELKIHRTTIYRWLERHPEMSIVVDETRRSMHQRFRKRLDLLVAQVIGKLEIEMERGANGARWASTAVLRYIERLQKMRDEHPEKLTYQEQLERERLIGPLSANPIVELPPLPPLPDGEQERIDIAPPIRDTKST